jgi:hypothetical protein
MLTLSNYSSVNGTLVYSSLPGQGRIPNYFLLNPIYHFCLNLLISKRRVELGRKEEFYHFLRHGYDAKFMILINL